MSELTGRVQAFRFLTSRENETLALKHPVESSRGVKDHNANAKIFLPLRHFDPPVSPPDLRHCEIETNPSEVSRHRSNGLGVVGAHKSNLLMLPVHGTKDHLPMLHRSLQNREG